MFRGTVTFRAQIKGDGLTFPLCEFNPGEAGVDKVEIESRNGDEILSTVHLASMATQEDGKAIATKVHTTALNRISFHHNIAIENGQISGTEFSPLDPPSGSHLYAEVGSYAYVGDAIKVILGIDPATLKTELEQPSPSGERYFGLLRSARQSMSPVEEFVHIYNILLMLFNNSFHDVDAFILSEDHAVPQTPEPRPGSRVMETVYTRLRHELGHARAHANLDKTKAEMTNRLGGLIALTKRAIELHH